MRILITLICASIFFTCCGQNAKQNYDYKCAEQLSEIETAKIQANSFENYTEKDLDLLAEITGYIIDSNPEKGEYECFFNRREKDLLVLDVFGLDDDKKISDTFCGLVETSNIKLPKKTIVIFHRYVNGYEDGGIIVVLKKK